MRQFSNNLTVFLSGLAFLVLTAVFVLNPSEVNIVKNGAGAAISKINPRTLSLNFISRWNAYLISRESYDKIIKQPKGEGVNLLAAPIVPCGLNEDYEGTTYDERKPCSICHLYILTGNLINFVIYNIAIPLAALMFLLAGVYLIFSGGSEERIKTGRTIFQNTVIALVIVFCSWVFLNTLFQTLVSKNFTWQWWQPFGECK